MVFFNPNLLGQIENSETTKITTPETTSETILETT